MDVALRTYCCVVSSFSMLDGVVPDRCPSFLEGPVVANIEPLTFMPIVPILGGSGHARALEVCPGQTWSPDRVVDASLAVGKLLIVQIETSKVFSGSACLAAYPQGNPDTLALAWSAKHNVEGPSLPAGPVQFLLSFAAEFQPHQLFYKGSAYHFDLAPLYEVTILATGSDELLVDPLTGCPHEVRGDVVLLSVGNMINRGAMGRSDWVDLADEVNRPTPFIPSSGSPFNSVVVVGFPGHPSLMLL
jgi:hypothetical protein